MARTITLKCPVYVEDKDDLCGENVEIDAWAEEKQTHWYPGSPPGFEVVDALCGHAAVIEDEYYDEVMGYLIQREIDAMERAAERRYDRKLERLMEAADA